MEGIVAVEGAGPNTVRPSQPPTESRVAAELGVALPRVVAAPPRRLAAAAREFAVPTSEALVGVTSLYGADERVRGFFGQLAGICRVAGRPGRCTSTCVPRPSARNALHGVNCNLTITMPSDGACQSVAGRRFATFVDAPSDVADADGRFERCCVDQVRVAPTVRAPGGAPEVSGWFYGDHTDAADPPNHASVEFACAAITTPPIHAHVGESAAPA